MTELNCSLRSLQMTLETRWCRRRSQTEKHVRSLLLHPSARDLSLRDLGARAEGHKSGLE
jgi:hypothetical protein